MDYSENVGFSLQKVTIQLGRVEELVNVEDRIKSAMETYRWIYREEGDHDVLVSIILPTQYIKGL